MAHTGAEQITALLQTSQSPEPPPELTTLVYEELRQMARARVARLSPGQTYRATDLVHEAWLKVLSHGELNWQSRAHFFGAAANAMRNILVDQARRRRSQKRDSSRREELDTDPPALTPDVPPELLIELHEALERLEGAHPRPARVVLLRFFAGLTMREVAEILELSVPTVDRDWRFARSWLQKDLRLSESDLEIHGGR